jgi:hypothetical protein
VTNKIKLDQVISDKGKLIKIEPADKSSPVILQAISDAAAPDTNQGRYFPRLKVGKTYVLFLQKLADRAEYFLPSRPEGCPEADEAAIAAARKAADIDKWAWGKPSEGLQMAMIVSGTRFTTVAGGADEVVRMHYNFVLRNVSDKPLVVNLYYPDKLYSLQAKGPEGKSAAHDFPVDMLARPGFNQAMVHQLPPGGMVFLCPTGLSHGRGNVLELPLTAGKWTLQAAYESKRQQGPTREMGKNPNPANLQDKLWTGQVKSGEILVEVNEVKPH